MSEPKLISPLLDGFSLGSATSEHKGIFCYPAIKENTDKKYIVKVITVPATQTQMDALLLAGAYKDPEDAMEYFRRVSEDVLKEAEFLKELSKLEGFVAYEGWQMEQITRRRLGYEVYLLGSYKRSLEKHVRKNPVTHLEAMNLALDLCSALSVCRQAGALYVDLKPGNIFISEKKEYQIGDLGFIKLNALKYTALPAKYYSCYTPPELSDPMESVNLTTDTYALGTILYQLYNEGKLPQIPDNSEEPILPPVNADYELSEIILKAIHPNIEERWQDPSQMGQAIVAYMQRNVINDTPITPYTPIDTDAQNVQIPREEPVAVPQKTPEVDAKELNLEFEVESAQEEVAIKLDMAVSEQEESDMEVVEDTAEEPPADIPKTEDVEENEGKSTPDASNVADEISQELSRIFAKADDLIAHETPAGVVLPEIPDAPDPFAFATEDSVELADLNTPFDPVMEEANGAVAVKDKSKKGSKFLSPERKRKFKKFVRFVITLLVIGLLCCAGFWYYQNVYIQNIAEIQLTSGRDDLRVTVVSEIDDELLQVSCSDNYGNIKTSALTDGEAVFTGLLPNTMYTVSVEIDGFHTLTGHTSEVFTTEATTNILSFSAVTGPEDGSAVISFTVDGDEPEEWAVIITTAGEEYKRVTFTGHTTTITDLAVGKEYLFKLDAGPELSLSGKESIAFLASRIILAENLSVVTNDGTDMTIRWTTPGDTVVESWNVRCYNDSDYDQTMTVEDTEVYLNNIDSTTAYTVEVTASGMTQPARTSITANPINITGLQVDDSKHDKLTVSWDYAGTKPESGWLLMYRIDGNANLNVIKCDTASAVITPHIPDADYSFTVQSVDGISVFNNMHEYACPAAPSFDFSGVKESDIKISLLKTPDDAKWSYDNTSSDAFTDTFLLGDPISVVLFADVDFYLPGTDVKLMYVIRDAHGNVIPDYVFEAKENWREIWNGGNYHYGELDLPGIPEAPGSYQMQIFIDGASVGQTTFTVE